MVDYVFYIEVYKGSAIAEQEWPAAEREAAAVLAKYKRIYTVVEPEPDAEKMAICAIAESAYSHAQAENAALSSASIGSVSVSYAGNNNIDHSPKQQAKDFYRAAQLYLDLYRGVQ